MVEMKQTADPDRITVIGTLMRYGGSNKAVPNSDYSIPMSLAVTEKGPYFGCERGVGSNSNLNSWLNAKQGVNLINMVLYDTLYGDSSVVVEGGKDASLGKPGLQGWLDAGEKFQGLAPVERVKDWGIVIGRDSIVTDSKLHKIGTDVKLYSGSPGNFGYWFQKAVDLKQALKEYESNLEGVALKNYLKKAGYDEENITEVSVNKDTGIASISKSLSRLNVSPELYAKVNSLAGVHGIEPEDFLAYLMSHEYTHSAGVVGNDPVEYEARLEGLIKGFYESLANNEFDGALEAVMRSDRSKRAIYEGIRRLAGLREETAHITYSRANRAAKTEKALEAVVDEVDLEDAEAEFNRTIERIAGEDAEYNDDVGDETDAEYNGEYSEDYDEEFVDDNYDADVEYDAEVAEGEAGAEEAAEVADDGGEA